jgi:predicted kinase
VIGKLTITRGIPGSGKTSWAKDYQNFYFEDRNRVVLVSRDDFRGMLFDASHGKLDHRSEKMITDMEADVVYDALISGHDVVEHSMNLRSSYVRAWAELAQRAGAEFEIKDLTNVPVATCIERDANRLHRAVGEDVIKDIYTRFVHKKPYPLPVPEVKHKYEKYVRPGDDWVGRTVIVDIDGTVAKNDGHRGWYEYDKVAGDKYHEDISDLVVHLAHSCGAHIVFMSGRSEDCRLVTEQWLSDYFGTFDFDLHMRASGDHRDDAIVKYELFDKHMRDTNIWFVLDDRDRVVNMWRELGVRCLQVAPGNF